LLFDGRRNQEDLLMKIILFSFRHFLLISAPEKMNLENKLKYPHLKVGIIFSIVTFQKVNKKKHGNVLRCSKNNQE
jgi:hypothetical protein